MKRKHQTTIKHLIQTLHNDDSLHLWSILTFLRGNDDSNKVLKDLTVGRVRALLGLPEDMGLIVNPDPLTASQQTHRAELLREGSPHFMNHYDTACDSIHQIYGYDLAHETWTCTRCAAFMPELGSCDRDLVKNMPPARRHICGTCRNYEARLRRDRRRYK